MLYDVCIIGAGVVGCAIARELSKYRLSICLIEKNEDVGAATSKANSGIVHGGYADKPGTLKAQLCVAGNALFDQLEQDLHFGFLRTGSFVVGFDEQDRNKIEELFSRGQRNGVSGLQIIDQDELFAREPNLNQQIKWALYCPSAGVVSPYEFAIALAENAIHNGVELKLNSPVTKLEQHEGHFSITTTNRPPLHSKIVINAAGLYADDVAALAGIDLPAIEPRAGQYLLFDRNDRRLINSIIFPMPSAVSKGILVTTTYYGNLLIGPDATMVEDKEYLDTTRDHIEEIIAAAKKTLPSLDPRKAITAFAGNRPSSSRHDFIIEENKTGLINVAAIESPGLTAAPAIALRVVDLIKASARINLATNNNFDSQRRPYKHIATMPPDQLHNTIISDPHYGCVVCYCELVSRGEIRDALHREIPINSLDAIKRRTRACAGRCQGSFCTPKIMDIISEELDVAETAITKKGGSSLLVTDSLTKLSNNEEV